MDHAEIVTLIRAGIPFQSGGTWGDFGAGWGNFTRALRELIGETGIIYAVDQDANAFQYLREAHGERGELHTLTADFTQPLDLPPLDGVVMANALHFVRDQSGALRRIAGYLRPGGRLVLVEYDMQLPRPWVPHPISQARFPDLIMDVGLQHPRIIGTRVSPSSGGTMYAGLALKL
jgi:ubiquinone/menaquinone biosynthesis C-methylase UbiE